MRLFVFIKLLIFLSLFLSCIISSKLKNNENKQYIVKVLKDSHLFTKDVPRELLHNYNNLLQKNEKYVPNSINLNYNLIKLGIRNSKILSEKIDSFKKSNPICPKCLGQVL
jgi:hypothetical protein